MASDRIQNVKSHRYTEEFRIGCSFMTHRNQSNLHRGGIDIRITTNMTYDAESRSYQAYVDAYPLCVTRHTQGSYEHGGHILSQTTFVNSYK